ncbi:MAG: hypothetical protein BRD49_03175 [Bacteroidetes bacterium SW_10_40_5]|nr:MAG: hypothetical protein BRD49_03175 [Bacteroidetes bacterium SW_10_40_5]
MEGVKQQVNLLIAESHYLIRQGMKMILSDQEHISITGQAFTIEELHKKAVDSQPDVLMVDYTSPTFTPTVLKPVLNQNPGIHVLAITPEQSKTILAQGLSLNINSFLLKNCGKDEIVEAIHATASNKNFFCGQILEKILEDHPQDLPGNILFDRLYATCEPLKLSEREVEIIRLIARGLTNKEIADRLYLSNHTIVTHRKNIMRKLNINNTAGLVVHAVKENIIDTD